MVSTLHLLLRRAATARTTTPVAAETLRAVALLPNAHDSTAAYAVAAIARRDMAAATDAVRRIKISPAERSHGVRAALLCSALSTVPRADDAMMQSLQSSVTAGLVAGAWHARHVRDAVRGVARWGAYAKDALPTSVERYVGTKAPYADGHELADVAAALTSVVECRTSPSLHTVAQRLAAIADTAPAAIIGNLCRSFVRARFQQPETLQAVLRQLSRVTKHLKGSDATAVLAWWALHDYTGLAPLLAPPDMATVAGRRAAAAVAEENEAITKTIGLWNDLTRRALAEMPDDPNGVIALLRCLTALSQDQWVAVSVAADEALEAAAVMSQELLAGGEAAIGVEDLTALMPRFFRAVRDRPVRLAPHDIAVATMDVFAEHAASRAEDLVAHESSPFFIVTCLLGAEGDPPPTKCRAAARDILLEAKAQEAMLPTLQTFRYTLSFGDHKDFDPRVIGFLRRNFAATLDGIPLVQLCTALRCFCIAMEQFANASGGKEASARTTGLEEGEELREERERQDFVADVVVALERREFAYDTGLMLALVESLSQLVPPDTPAAEAAKRHTGRHLQALVVAGPSPAAYSREAAAAALSFFAGKEEYVNEATRAFLESVVAEGKEASAEWEKPSVWMKRNDPSGTILPRTADEQKIDAVLKDLKSVPAEDAVRLQKLGSQFLRLLPSVHPDNLRFLFELFADRVIKQDKTLRDAIVHLLDTESVPRLSAYSVSSILRSCAVVRFTYFKPLKSLLATVTDEQWALLDPVELEMSVAALGRLGIRTPSVILALSDRAMALAPSLTERHVCSIIAAFQQLGVHDDALFAALLGRASQVADALTPSAVALLLSGPLSYRLPLTEQTAAPLVDRLCRVSDDLAPHQKTRIGATLKRTSLPPSLLAGASARMLLE